MRRMEEMRIGNENNEREKREQSNFMATEQVDERMEIIRYRVKQHEE